MKMGGGGGDQAAAKPGFSSEGNPYQKPKTQRIWPTIFLKMGGIIPRTLKNGGTRPPVPPPCGGAPAFICRSPCRLQLASMKWSRQVTHLPCQCATADLLASADVPYSLAHQRFGGGGQLRSFDFSGITSRVCHHETFFLGSPKKKSYFPWRMFRQRWLAFKFLQKNRYPSC